MLQISEQPNQALEAGTWADYKGSRLLIAHAGNLKFQRRMQTLQKPFRRKIERNEFDPADQKKILVKCLAETILIGWEKVKGADGKQVEYSARLAEVALTNDEELREFVMEFSMDMANFKQEEAEHEGNS